MHSHLIAKMKKPSEIPKMCIIALATGIRVFLHYNGGFVQDNIPLSLVEMKNDWLKLEIAKQRKVTTEQFANTRLLL